MTTQNKLSIDTPNNEIGLFFTRSGRITIGQDIGELATWIKAMDGGVIVWHNSQLKETGVWELGDGETVPIAFDKILASGVVGGVTETTTASGLYWATAAIQVG